MKIKSISISEIKNNKNLSLLPQDYLDKSEKNKRFYKVKTKFIFDGHFSIYAESRQQAKEFVKKHCGLVIGGDIHSTLPSEDVDWDFIVHPNKIITTITKK